MRVVIAGGTGFLGRSLADSFTAAGHAVAVLSRIVTGSGVVTHVPWKPDGSTGPWASHVDGADVVVNLAGESIAGARWSDAHKRRILESRVQATRSLVSAIRSAARPPRVFLSGSAVGYYGPRGDEPVDEAGAPGEDFLANVCRQWEAEAARAAGDRTRVVFVRTGLVLARDGGALPQMLPPFWFGAGGPVGSGRQYWPWIHRDDWVSLVRWAADADVVSGPLNVTAPAPVTNKAFAQALGRAMHRPAFMPAPAFALRLILGEMADALLLSGQRAMPAKATELGFAFRYNTIDDALRALF